MKAIVLKKKEAVRRRDRETQRQRDRDRETEREKRSARHQALETPAPKVPREYQGYLLVQAALGFRLQPSSV